MKLIFLIFTFLNFATEAFATDKIREVQHWSADCIAEGKKFAIRFDSTAPYDRNEITKVKVVSDQGEIEIPVKAKWYYQRAGLSQFTDNKSACKDLPVYRVGNDQYLIFLSGDSRPGFDTLTVFLYDLRHNSFLDKIDEVGNFKSVSDYDAFMTLKTKDGVKTRLVKDYIKDTGSDGAIPAIEDWKYIHVHHGHLTATW